MNELASIGIALAGVALVAAIAVLGAHCHEQKESELLRDCIKSGNKPAECREMVGE